MLVETESFRRFVRFLFRWKGLRALGHLVRRMNYEDKVVEVGDFDGDLKFRCYMNEHIGSQMYWRGAYSGPQLDVLRDILRDEMVFIDIGANQGEFSLFAAKRLPNGQIFAFEPSADMATRLQRNIEANGFSNIHVVPLALSSESGQKTLYVSRQPFYDGSVHEGLGTLYASESRDQVVQQVSVTTLDDYIRENRVHRVDVIKIDIEGGEFDALKGAEGTIREHQPVILMEANKSNLVAAQHSLEELLAYLGQWYEFEIITNRGSKPVANIDSLGEHQDLLLRPKSRETRPALT